MRGIVDSVCKVTGKGSPVPGRGVGGDEVAGWPGRQFPPLQRGYTRMRRCPPREPPAAGLQAEGTRQLCDHPRSRGVCRQVALNSDLFLKWLAQTSAVQVRPFLAGDREPRSDSILHQDSPARVTKLGSCHASF